MKALVFCEQEKIGFESVADPKIVSPEDVLIAVEKAAICGSDLHPYFGREKGLDPGTVMGHEAVGTVIEVGRAITRLKKGDRVFSPFTTNCGTCFYCKLGLTCRCEKGQLYGWVEQGRGLPGLQSELARIPLAESTLMKVPEGVSSEEALLLGDILSTGFFCAEMGEVGPERTCVVIGCGPVGLMAILGAREKNAKTIFALDLVPERLAAAERFGAIAIDIKTENPLQRIHDATQGRGADSVLELVGNESSERLAFELVRPGGVLAVAGVHTATHFTFSPPEAYGKNLTYRVGRCPARSYMERLVPLVQSKKYDLASLFSHRLPLEKGADGYRLFAEKREGCTKVLLEVG